MDAFRAPLAPELTFLPESWVSREILGIFDSLSQTDRCKSGGTIQGEPLDVCTSCRLLHATCGIHPGDLRDIMILAVLIGPLRALVAVPASGRILKKRIRRS